MPILWQKAPIGSSLVGRVPKEQLPGDKEEGVESGVQEEAGRDARPGEECQPSGPRPDGCRLHGDTQLPHLDRAKQQLSKPTDWQVVQELEAFREGQADQDEANTEEDE